MLLVDRLFVLAFRLGFPPASNRNPARLHADLKLFRLKARHLSPNRKAFVGFRNINVNGMQQFRLGLKPVFEVASERLLLAFKDFESATRDRVV